MQRLFRLVSLVPALFLVLPPLTAQDIPNPDRVRIDPKVRIKLLSAEYMTGKLTKIEGEEEKVFTLEVAHKVPVLNQEMNKKRLEIEEQGRKTKDPATLQRLLQQYQEVKNKLYDMEEVPIEFELKGPKDLPYRKLKLAPKEDGTPYTAEEKAKLKGENPKLPGYTAEAKDFDVGLQVRVFLDRSRIKLPSATKTKKKDGEPEDPMIYPITSIMLVPIVEPGASGGENPLPVEPKPDSKTLAKILDAVYIDGKLVKCDPEKGGYVVEVIRNVAVPNPEQQKRYQDLYKQYTDAFRAGQQAQVAALSTQLKDAYGKINEYKPVTYVFPLEAAKDLKVRIEKLPPKELGDDGKPGKYTPDELKKAKGDDAKAPGYTAKVEDLAPDLYVRVWLDKSKIKPVPKPKPGEEPEEDTTIYPVLTIMIREPPAEKPMGTGIGGGGGIGK